MVYYMGEDGMGISEKNIMFGVRVCGDQNFDANMGARSVCKRVYMHTRMQKKLFELTFECGVNLCGV